MARYAQLLVQKNPVTGCRIEVVEKKIEELHLDEKVDVLISEPIGTLLVNERMLETYIFARDHFLKPGGKMLPVEPLCKSHTSKHGFLDCGENPHGALLR